MNKETIAHDLTVALITKCDKCNSPDAIVNAYHELLPKVQKAYTDYNKKHIHKGEILNRSDFDI